MKNAMLQFATAGLTMFVAPAIWAQPVVRDAVELSSGYHLRPRNPSSANQIVMIYPEGSCGGLHPYVANPYQITMSKNNIVVTLGARTTSIAPLCPANPSLPIVEQVDIGLLPAGDYTITVLRTPPRDSAGGSPTVQFENAPFTVVDARATKTAPYVRLNYSGGWYDPNDPGWGLFISQNYDDSLVASWFTYTASGKAEWYTFQPVAPRWATGFQTITDNFYLLNRDPGATSPPLPPSRTSVTPVGRANLNFTPLAEGNESFFGYTFNSAVFTYTFTGGQPQVRTIRRFLQ